MTKLNVPTNGLNQEYFKKFSKSETKKFQKFWYRFAHVTRGIRFQEILFFCFRFRKSFEVFPIQAILVKFHFFTWIKCATHGISIAQTVASFKETYLSRQTTALELCEMKGHETKKDLWVESVLWISPNCFEIKGFQKGQRKRPEFKRTVETFMHIMWRMV